MQQLVFTIAKCTFMEETDITVIQTTNYTASIQYSKGGKSPKPGEKILGL